MTKVTELKPENFLILERSLSDRLKKRWVAQFAPIKKQLLAAERNDDPITAHDIVESLDQLADLNRGMKQYIEYVGTAAVLFGASRVRPLEETTFMTGPKQVPEVVKQATLVFGHLLTESRKTIKKVAHQMLKEIEKQRVLDHDAQLFKADAIRDEQYYIDRIQEAGEGTIDIAASLHTSRLSSYGFLIEADATEVTEYQIDEVLDARTCSLCNYMHGKTFKVERALDRIEQLVMVDDPEELKVLAPFFQQTKDNLIKLRMMNPEALALLGMDTPPFHPACRGLLAMAGTVTEIEETRVSGRIPESFFVSVEVDNDPVDYAYVLQELPPELRKIVLDTPPPVKIKAQTGERAYYNSNSRVIVSDSSSRDGLSFKHEYGHYIDHQLGGNTYNFWSEQNQDFRHVFERDKKNFSVYLWDDDPVDDYTAQKFWDVLYNQTPDGVVHSNYDSEATGFFSDILDAMTKGKLATDWAFQGHGTGYFSGAQNTSDVTETFANLFALYQHPIIWPVVQSVLPETTQLFMREIKRIANI